MCSNNCKCKHRHQINQELESLKDSIDKICSIEGSTKIKIIASVEFEIDQTGLDIRNALKDTHNEFKELEKKIMASGYTDKVTITEIQVNSYMYPIEILDKI